MNTRTQISQIITLPPPAHVPSHPRYIKENVIQQTRPPSNIAPWSSSGAPMPIVGAFGSRPGQHGHTDWSAEPMLLCVPTLFYNSQH